MTRDQTAFLLRITHRTFTINFENVKELDDIIHITKHMTDIGWVSPLKLRPGIGFYFMAFKCKIIRQYYKLNEVCLMVRVTSLKNLCEVVRFHSRSKFYFDIF